MSANMPLLRPRRVKALASVYMSTWLVRAWLCLSSCLALQTLSQHTSLVFERKPLLIEKVMKFSNKRWEYRAERRSEEDILTNEGKNIWVAYSREECSLCTEFQHSTFIEFLFDETLHSNFFAVPKASVYNSITAHPHLCARYSSILPRQYLDGVYLWPRYL